MGQASRSKPQRLAEKLVAIRNRLGLSQKELIKRLHAEDELTQARVSAYDRGIREPSLLILLAYARLVKVSTDVLMNGKLALPKRLPSLV